MRNHRSGSLATAAAFAALIALAACAPAGHPRESPDAVALTVQGAGGTLQEPAAQSSLDAFRSRLVGDFKDRGLEPRLTSEGEAPPAGAPLVVVRVLELPRLGEGWRGGRVVASARCVADGRVVLDRSYEEHVFSDWSAQGGAPTGDQPQQRAMELAARAIVKDVARALGRR